MNEFLMKSRVQEIHNFLEDVITQFEGYLNGVTINMLLQERPGDKVYYEGLFSNLRRLVVHCEDGLDSCTTLLQLETYKKDLAEKDRKSVV